MAISCLFLKSYGESRLARLVLDVGVLAGGEAFDAASVVRALVIWASKWVTLSWNLETSSL